MRKKFNSIPTGVRGFHNQPFCHFCKHLDRKSVYADDKKVRDSIEHIEEQNNVPSDGYYLPFDTHWLCAAFPQGIPIEIVKERFDHREKHPEDNGIQFEAIDYEEETKQTYSQLRFIRPEYIQPVLDNKLYRLEAGRRYGATKPYIEVDPEHDEFPIYPSVKKNLIRLRGTEQQIEKIRFKENREPSRHERNQIWFIQGLKCDLDEAISEDVEKEIIGRHLASLIFEPELVVAFCRENGKEDLLVALAKSENFEQKLRDLYQTFDWVYPEN